MGLSKPSLRKSFTILSRGIFASPLYLAQSSNQEPSIHILSIGLNHTTTPVELRERLAFSEEQVRTALSRLSCGYANITSDMKEMIIISTCNRIEIYAASDQKTFSELEAFLSDARAARSS